MNKEKYKLNPNWVTGFTDAEGCFMIYVCKSKSIKTGWRVEPCFKIMLHAKDKNLLLQIKSFFNEVGNIYTKNNVVSYQVRSLNELLQIIIPHYEKYPLITQKQSDFLLFKDIVKLIDQGKHLKKEFLLKIIKLKASLNKGLSSTLKVHFTEGIKIERPKVFLPNIIDYNWIAGFTSGDGCFQINLYKSKTHKLGYSVKLEVKVTQHSRDELLIKHLVNTLDCGIISKRFTEKIVDFKVYKFEDIYNKIIPLFNKHNIKGVKALDYKDFCKAAELVNKKAHLTPEGLEEIRKIKSKMNRGRTYL